MMTLNMTAGNDNQLIWFVVIKTDDYTFRFATETKVLTNTYDGGVMWNYGISDVRETVGLGSGGSIGAKSTFRFLIARYNSGTNTDDFFNEFYPATSGRVLTNREVNIGFAWSGITADSQITWLKKYFIKDYEYDPSVIEIYCVEKREYELREIPYYKVQKDWDNGVSYFTNALEEIYGKEIPIIYGDFTLISGEGITKNIISAMSPCLLIDKTIYKSIISSHECYSNADIYQYVEELNIKQSIDAYNILSSPVQVSSKSTGLEGTYFTLLEDEGTIIGSTILYPTMRGQFSPINDFTFDRLDGLDPYRLDAGDIIAFKFPFYENAPMLGKFNDETQIQLKIDFTNTVNPPGGSNNIQIKTYDSLLQSDIDTLNTIITLSETKTIDYSSIFTITNWDWEKLLNLEFIVRNLYSTPGQYIWINKIYLYANFYYAKGYYGIGKIIRMSYPKIQIKFRR